jgi:mono/diheme cytochrome c family protein
MNRIRHLVGSICVVGALASSQVAAQEIGHAAAGRTLARQLCSECHAVERTQALSPDNAAPRFETIANVPGMTGAALSVALQRSHELMPNVILDANQLSDIVTYILSLRRAD